MKSEEVTMFDTDLPESTGMEQRSSEKKEVADPFHMVIYSPRVRPRELSLSSVDLSIALPLRHPSLNVTLSHSYFMISHLTLTKTAVSSHVSGSTHPSILR